MFFFLPHFLKIFFYDHEKTLSFITKLFLLNKKDHKHSLLQRSAIFTSFYLLRYLCSLKSNSSLKLQLAQMTDMTQFMQNKTTRPSLPETLLFGGERRARLSSALLSSGVRAGRDRSPLGRTWRVAALWSDNSPQPEGDSPNWNVFWQRDSRCFGRIEPPSGNRENWDVGEKERWSETGCCSNTGSNKQNSTDESRRL